MDSEDLINQYEAKVYEDSVTVQNAYAKLSGIYHSWIGSLLDCKDLQDFEDLKNHITNKLKERY